MPNERKLQIVKAAAKRFARHGINKTTLDEVARDIRIGKATIYHYFISKDDLFIETIKWENELYLDQIKNTLTNEESPINRRIIDYLNYKEQLSENHHLIYELVLNYLNERSSEKENEIIQKLISKEEEIIKSVLSVALKDKMISLSPALPHFIAIYGWGNLFGSKLRSLFSTSKTTHSKEFLVKSIESILT
jgi:AcrR family transcriptional regulator